MNKLKLNKKNQNSEHTPELFLIFIPGDKNWGYPKYPVMFIYGGRLPGFVIGT